MLVTRLVNVRYLSGFTGSNAALLIRADDDTPVLATDGRYRTQAAPAGPRRRDRDRARLRAVPGRPCRGRRRGTAGLRKPRRHRRRIRRAREGRPCDTELVRAAGTVESLREIKDAGEIALLRLACEAADAALADLVDNGGLRPGRTEREVGRELESLMLDHGADGVSFETIVAAGANSAIPHHRPTDAVLAAGDFVKIDFGALVCGYHSDMTRTFVLAPAAQWQLDLYELVAAAQRAGREAVGPGVALRDVDAASRQVIADAGYADNFTHGLGPRRRFGDPRSAGNQRVRRRYTACWLRGDCGARCLLARSRRCPHRGHAGRVRDDARLAYPVPQGTGRFSVERRGVVPPWHRPPTSRMDSSCRSMGSCGPSSSSSTSSRARVPRSCAPS